MQMEDFFRLATSWVYTTHRQLSYDFSKKCLRSSRSDEIYEFCSYLLTIMRIAAEHKRYEVETQLYDLFLYWQNRVLFANDYELDWNIVGKAPLPDGLTQSLIQSLSDIEIKNFSFIGRFESDVIITFSIISHFCSQGDWTNIDKNKKKPRLARFYTGSFLKAITSAVSIRYNAPILHNKEKSAQTAAWQIELSGEYHSNYPVIITINESLLDTRSLITIVSTTEYMVEGEQNAA